ncbi:hypothetical protein B296_00000721 [Ensete ventricosum]|uniref:Uncharacterized protein n=1 Tax=Ensete ventricosum TaxID=4639 RepID=A0A427AIL8_ENSVE|nr:hypothetical protein B296_00000721 [Ensete ventricosum]
MGATEMVRVRCFLCMTLLILLSAAAGTMDVGYVQPSNATMFHGVAGGGVEWLETEMTVSSSASKTHIDYRTLNPNKPAVDNAKSGQPYKLLLLLVAAAGGGGRDVGEARLHQLNGTIGQMYAVEEWSLGSETARRILQSTQNSISYGALQKDRVPLQASQPGNPYTRGCQAVYNCKS